MRRLIAVLIIGGTITLQPTRVRGQTVTVTVTPTAPCRFRQPTAAHFDAGVLDTAFTVTVTATAGAVGGRMTRLRLRTTSTQLWPGKPLASFQWRLLPTGAFAAFPAANTWVTAGDIPVTISGPFPQVLYTRTFQCRLLVSWADPPRGLSQWNLQVGLTVAP
ncbi:MAG: hypothetical protein ACK53A_08595 [Gemmatimonadota bacterium]|jgi:hypothetical protein|nr:hypothetical protein [Gemmatimonadota bacterium]